MRRKLYFVLPNAQSAQKVMDELLLARIEDRYIHFHAKNDAYLKDLPRANTAEKSSTLNSSVDGILCGAGIGLIGGVIAYMFPWWFGSVNPMVIPCCMVIGAVACALWGNTVAKGVPNRKLESYKKEIEQGNVIAIVSVPLYRLNEIRDLLLYKHPEAFYGGTWPKEHAMFP